MIKKILQSKILILFAASFLCPVLLYAQDTSSINKYIPTVTLLVKRYSELENNLQTAITKNDIKKTQAFLADDFEERQGQAPNKPIPKDVWLANIKLAQEKNFVIKEMAVKKYGDIFIVSFKKLIYSDNQSDATTYFIVDVWQNTSTKALLVVRYASTSLN